MQPGIFMLKEEQCNISVISCLSTLICSKACFVNILHWEKGAILPCISWIIVALWVCSDVAFCFERNL